MSSKKSKINEQSKSVANSKVSVEVTSKGKRSKVSSISSSKAKSTAPKSTSKVITSQSGSKKESKNATSTASSNGDKFEVNAKSGAIVSGTAKSKIIDPSNTAPPPKDANERSAKVSKNEEAIKNIIDKLRAIPLDNLSEETKNDLIKIHAIARGIVLRYVIYRVDKEKAKLADILEKVERAEEDAKKATSGEKREKANQADGVLPSFEDIQWPEMVGKASGASKSGSGKESVAEVQVTAASVAGSAQKSSNKSKVGKSKVFSVTAKSGVSGPKSNVSKSPKSASAVVEKSSLAKSTTLSKKDAGKKEQSQPGTIKLEAKKITLN